MNIVLSYSNEYAVITLTRPDALNALSFSIIRELEDVIDEVASSKAKALIVTGAGDKAFCAGADIKELMGRSIQDQKSGAELGQKVFHKLSQLPMPSIAVVNGFAFGGGLELALACTFRLATPNARMGLPEIKLGLIPGYGGTQRLPRIIGESRAMELIMTGRAVKPEEAERLGLVNRLVDGDPVEAGKVFASEFSGFGALALGYAREAVQRALDLPVSEGLKVEADLSTLAFQTEDAAEGMAAFVDKRTPTFKDR